MSFAAIFAALLLLVSSPTYAQADCSPDNELVFGVPTYDAGLNAYAVDVFWENPPPTLMGLIFTVTTSFGSEILLSETVQSFNPIFADYPNFTPQLGSNGTLLSVNAVIPSPAQTIVINDAQPLFLYTLHFTGDPGCYEAQFASGAYLVLNDDEDGFFPCGSISTGPPVSDLCFEALELSGFIQRFSGNCDGAVNGGIPGVNVEVEGIVGIECSTTTDNSGEYACEVAPAADGYQVTPTKSDNPDCGVDFLDLAIYQNHLYYYFYGENPNYEPFASPYQFYAADLDRNGIYTVLDLVSIKRLALGILIMPPTFRSWDFVPRSDYGIITGPTPTGTGFNHPFFPYENFTFLDEVFESVANIDFVGIKMGDLNNSCTNCGDGDNLQGPLASESRAATFSSRQISVSCDAPSLANGEQKTVAYRVQNLESNLNYFQIALDFATEYLEVVEVATTYGEEFDYTIGPLDEYRSQIRCNWLNLGAFPRKGIDEFTVWVTVRAKQQLPQPIDYMHFDQHWSVGYDSEFVNYQLQLTDRKNMRELAVRIEPQPSTTAGTLSIDGLQRGELSLYIFDGTGRLAYQTDLSVTENEYTFSVGTFGLPGNGLYYYRVVNEAKIVSGKLLLVE